jgi:hypothetical protein
MSPEDRDGFLFEVRMALRRVPGGILRRLGQRRWPVDDHLAEDAVRATILDQLLRSRWRVERLPPVQKRPSNPLTGVG